MPNPGHELMTQMTAQVFFVTAQAKDAVLVPIAALRPVRQDGQRGERKKGENKGRGEAKGGGAQAPSLVDPRTQFANGRAAVRVVHEDGTIEERQIKVGVMTRVSAQVLEGLEPGEQVVAGLRTAAGTRPSSASNPNAPRFQPRI